MFSGKQTKFIENSLRNIWFINSKISITNNDNSYLTIRGRRIMSIKMEFYHFYVIKSLDISDPCHSQMMDVDMLYDSVSIKKYIHSALTTFHIHNHSILRDIYSYLVRHVQL